MSRPRLLDLFCGAGGAAAGYARAGFDVVGVDIEDQPHYPFEFHQADALKFPLDGFDAIHASPPCQFATTMSNRHRGQGGRADGHLNLIPPTLERLHDAGVPWVIENVPGAREHMPNAFTLTGGMFGLQVHRPRLFGSNVLVFVPPPAPPPQDAIGVYGKHHDGRLLWARADGTEQRAARIARGSTAGDGDGLGRLAWRQGGRPPCVYGVNRRPVDPGAGADGVSLGYHWIDPGMTARGEGTMPSRARQLEDGLWEAVAVYRHWLHGHPEPGASIRDWREERASHERAVVEAAMAYILAGKCRACSDAAGGES